MATDSVSARDRNSSTRERQWYIVGRWQEYEGEGQANLLRVIAIGVFYLIQLGHFHVLSAPSERDVTFHEAATALAATGSLASLAILLCLRRRIFPAGLKFISTGCDILLVTALAALGNGPQSPLVLVYFLIIVLAGLRFNLRLIWCTAGGCMLGYVFLLGMRDSTWFDSDHFVPPVEQIMTLTSLALTGVFVGQVVRRTRTLAEGYSRRLGATRVDA